jgi:SAM-dependent methyltransferase
MNHADHVRLIAPGVRDAGPSWLELGAGEGAFSLALADLLGPFGHILALDRDAAALRRLEAAASTFRPATGSPASIEILVGDIRDALPVGPWDGVLAANSLHFLEDPVAVLRSAATVLHPGGRFIVVEYDADRGNPWVPHPFSARRFPTLAADAGFVDAHEIGRVPSRFLGAIYAAMARRQATSTVTS